MSLPESADFSAIYRVITNIQKDNFVLFLIQKFKQNPVSIVDGETPLSFELAVKLVRIKTRIERFALKQYDPIPSTSLELRVEPAKHAQKSRAIIDYHRSRGFNLGSLPAL